MRKENVDVVGEKPVKNDTGEMSMNEEAKQNAWAEHYERLLNVEFDWDPDHLSNEPPLEGPPIRGATILQKAYCDILRYGKPVLRYILRYTCFLYFCLLLPLVQHYTR